MATLMFVENVGAGIYDLARRELFFLVLHLSSQLLIVNCDAEQNMEVAVHVIFARKKLVLVSDRKNS